VTGVKISFDSSSAITYSGAGEEEDDVVASSRIKEPSPTNRNSKSDNNSNEASIMRVEEVLKADEVVLAVGHSARALYTQVII
jgi:hypothetical protein